MVPEVLRPARFGRTGAVVLLAALAVVPRAAYPCSTSSVRCSGEPEVAFAGLELRLPEVDDSLQWRRALATAHLEARTYDHFEPAWPAHAPEGRSLSSCGPDPLDDYLLDEWFPYRDRDEVEREVWEASVEPVLAAWRKVAASEGSWLAMAEESGRGGDSAAAIAALREGLQHHPDSESLGISLLRSLGWTDPDAARQYRELVGEEEPKDTLWTLTQRIRDLVSTNQSGADPEVALAPLLDELIERQEAGGTLQARTAAASWLSPSSCEIALRLLPPDEVTVPQAGEKPVWGEQQACVLEQCSERQRAAALRLQLLPFWEKERFAGVLWWPESKLKGLEWDVKRELASRITAEPEATVWRPFYDLALRRLGDEAGRVSNLRSWLAVDPDDPRALSALASLLVGAGELTEARRLLERQVELGDSEVLRFRIATIDALSGDWERVRQQVVELLDGKASTPRRRAEVSYLMGRVALETGTATEALRHLRDWVELAQTRDAFPISLVALAHAEAGGVEWSAWQALDKRVRAQVDERPGPAASPQRAAAMRVAWALRAAGRGAAAVELAAWANALPGEPPSLDLAADCLMNGESCRVDLSPPVAGWPELDALVLHRWRGEGSRAERPSR